MRENEQVVVISNCKMYRQCLEEKKTTVNKVKKKNLFEKGGGPQDLYVMYMLPYVTICYVYVTLCYVSICYLSRPALRFL